MVRNNQKTTNPSTVSNGVYRIRSAERASPHLYLERQMNGEVRPVQLNKTNTNQQWRITQESGVYQIINVGTGAGLSILPYVVRGTRRWRAYSGGAQSWTLDPRGEGFVIGNPENNMCLELTTANWVVVWTRRNAIAQQWTLEPVSTSRTRDNNDYNNDDDDKNGEENADENDDADPDLPKAGTYKLVNFHTQASFAPSANGPAWFLIDSVRLGGRPKRADSSWWTVTPSPSSRDKSLYTISGYSQSIRGYLLSPSSPGVGTYAKCTQEKTTVRVVPSKRFVGAYNIILGAGRNEKTILDKNSPGKATKGDFTQPANLAEFNATDSRQAWIFEAV